MNDKRDMDGPVDNVGHEDCQVVSVKLKRKRKLKQESFDERKPKSTKPESDDSRPVKVGESNEAGCDDIKTDVMKLDIPIESDVKTHLRNWDHNYALNVHLLKLSNSDVVINGANGYLKSEPIFSDTIKLDTTDSDTLKYGFTEHMDYDLNTIATVTEGIMTFPEFNLSNTSPVNITKDITYSGASSPDNVCPGDEKASGVHNEKSEKALKEALLDNHSCDEPTTLNAGAVNEPVDRDGASNCEKDFFRKLSPPEAMQGDVELSKESHQWWEKLDNHSCNKPTLNVDAFNEPVDGDGASNCEKDLSATETMQRDVLSKSSHQLLEKGFTHKNNLAKHLTIHDEGERQMCLICEQRFDDIEELKLHMVIHTQSTKHFVPECLKRYIKVYAPSTRPYVCIFCGSGFTEIFYAAKHILKHEYCFSCGKCGKETVTKKAWWKKCFLCRWSTQKPGSKAELIAIAPKPHEPERQTRLVVVPPKPVETLPTCWSTQKPGSVTELIATPLKPHEPSRKTRLIAIRPKTICSWCGEPFVDELELDDHFATHALEGDVSYSCLVCRKSFADEQHLKHHRTVQRHRAGERTKHKQALYLCKLCALCGKTFRFKSAIEEHFNTCHKREFEVYETSMPMVKSMAMEQYIHTVPVVRMPTIDHELAEPSTHSGNSHQTDGTSNCEANVSPAESNVLTITPVLDVENPVLKEANSVFEQEKSDLQQGNSGLELGNPVLEIGNPALKEANSVLKAGNYVLSF